MSTPRTDMTPDQVSFLLYLETCVVDQCGRVDSQKVNADDLAQAFVWAGEGFIGWGRVVSKDGGGNWVEFSDDAWITAHTQRRAKGLRMAERREWTKTSEKNID
jgi:hypothetical protein